MSTLIQLVCSNKCSIDLHATEVFFCLATRKTSNGDSRCISRNHFSAALFPQLQV